MFQTFSFPNKLKVIQVFKELGEKKEKKKKIHIKRGKI